ncbi:hypothetical protein IMG5_019560 [Ichthyophthirius multifiliis]|uniref:beta-mannosidase n=1 Tax=Ichthyophthirius multifiliis TaxID=5932 RepID=G0QKM1_ICHMU|nr:hypothetical protein IMG5_019560 [Ichthyophthirius multifiliis]EGR34239.1 hypothetical protein IMG5_019560 [Ichthyophthirius multifiliis]|eukprot:XP_004039543.1 hypothetical protein IMG5_019560 [Ichthyophthirius multifiliis]
MLLFIFYIFFKILNCLYYLNQSDWYFKEYTNETNLYSNFMRASIPSTVHLDLSDNQIMPDPYFRDNLLQYYQLEYKDWVYTTLLDTQKIQEIFQKQNYDQIELVFEGLDTHADVYLNQNLILQTNNMFRTWKIYNFEKYINQNINITIIFKSSVKHDLDEEKKLLPIKLPYNYTFSRKAAYQYGWDWGPRLVTCGIWKDAYLQFIKKGKILNSHFRTLQLTNIYQKNGTAQKALMELNIELHLLTSYNNYSIQVFCENQIIIQKQLIQQNLKNIYQFEIQNPILWWCRGLGQPFLYKFYVYLLFNNQVIDFQQYSIGIRQIKVLQRQDLLGNGTSFMFYLNDNYVFMKGSNYIPPDMFMPRAQKNPEIYMKNIQNAIKANHNMIRLWGGGQFEYDIFYDLCDQNGILIWHDLMFACAMYPSNNQILQNIEKELLIIYQDQEIILLLLYGMVIMKCIQNGQNQDGKIILQILKDKLFGDGILIYLIQQQERLFQIMILIHFIGLHHHLNLLYINILQIKGIFIFGMYGQTYPRQKIIILSLEDLIANMGCKVYYLISLQENSHLNKIDIQILLYYNIMKGMFLVGQIFNFIFKTIIMNLKIYKPIYMLVRVCKLMPYRLLYQLQEVKKPYCSGSLYWQLNDVWPVVSWSSVDFYGNWKGLHFRGKNLYEGLIGVLEQQQNDFFNLKIINDFYEDFKVKISLSIINNEGFELVKILDQNVFFIEENSNVCIFKNMDLISQYQKNQIGAYLQIQYGEEKDFFWEKIFYFVKPNEFLYKKSSVQVHLDSFGKNIIVSSDKLTRDIYILCDNEDEIEGLSNNYFDLVPGKVVSLKYEQKDVCQNIKYYSLNQLFLDNNTIQKGVY